MQFAICFQSDPEQLQFLPKITSLKAGLELQSFGLKGVQSHQEWDERLRLHRNVLKLYHGPLAAHGPFLGMRYNHRDILFKETVQKRMDMTFLMATEFKVNIVVLHTTYNNTEKEKEWDQPWLNQTVAYWRNEIGRWESKGIRIALENVLERDPDLMIALTDQIGNLYFGLCLDVGHCNLYSTNTPVTWIKKIGQRLFHAHLHDNNGIADQHLPLGKGTINYRPIFKAFKSFAPNAMLSLEAQVDMQTKVDNLEYIIKSYRD